MVDILARVPHDGLEAVLVAVELALEANNPSREHVFNLLSRLQAPPSPDPIATSLTLREEPQANVARYDTLRGFLPWAAVVSLLTRWLGVIDAT